MTDTYDVRIWGIREHESKNTMAPNSKKPKTTYSLRWIVAGKTFSESFPGKALAESFRAGLVTAARKGEAFDTVTGLPSSQNREAQTGPSWYQHAVDYVGMKWPAAAAKSRAGIAETLAAVTVALLRAEPGRPDDGALRAALYGWTFNLSRAEVDRPGSVRETLAWVERASLPLTDLLAAATTRRALDAIALKLDGKTAAAKTIGRKRAVFYYALNYAVELGRLEGNPIGRVQWHTPKTVQVVDSRVVVNPAQARALLRAVRSFGKSGERLEVMFALMYFAALRPSEALEVRDVDCVLPESGWGEVLLVRSSPRVGSAWTDSGRSRDERGLKHRPAGEVRRVPLCPELVARIRRHLCRFGAAPDGRIVATAQGEIVSDSWYGRVWGFARTMALSEAQAASPLAQRPYDLRHAAVSTWLNAGVPATQVAEWAGHTVEVLLKVYAKCLDGQGATAMRLIELTLGEPDEPAPEADAGEAGEPASELGEDETTT